VTLLTTKEIFRLQQVHTSSSYGLTPSMLAFRSSFSPVTRRASVTLVSEKGRAAEVKLPYCLSAAAAPRTSTLLAPYDSRLDPPSGAREDFRGSLVPYCAQLANIATLNFSAVC